MNKEDLVHEILLVIDDETELVAARKNLEKEHRANQELQGFLHAVVRRGFTQTLLAFEDAGNIVAKMIRSASTSSPQQSVTEVLIGLHTLKGNMRALKLNDFSRDIHGLEHELIDCGFDDFSLLFPQLKHSLVKVNSYLLKYSKVLNKYFNLPRSYEKVLLEYLKDFLDSANLGAGATADQSFYYREAELILTIFDIPYQRFSFDTKHILETLRSSIRYKEIEESFRNRNTIEIYESNLEEALNCVDHLDIPAMGRQLLLSRLHKMEEMPLKARFDSFHAMIQDVSARLGKDVKINIDCSNKITYPNREGEMLSSAMGHIIRNSIDHGIENPMTREEIGKDCWGNISIMVSENETDLAIEIRDDGRGIDINKIREKAVTQNIISAEEKLSEEELMNLIFLESFSTASKVSEISGRGVGMQAVQDMVQSLGGFITVNSRLNSGTSFKIVLPSLNKAPNCNRKAG